MKHLIAALRDPHAYEWRRLRPWQKHSEVLAVAGTVYLGIGLAYMIMPVRPDRQVALSVLIDHVPLSTWGALWFVVGLLALASTRWPPASKTWGYTALTMMAALWGSAYLVGVLFLHAPISGLLGALVYGLVGYLWYAIAGLANPDDLIAALVPQEEHDVTDETGV